MRISPDGTVHAPSSGTFDVAIAPGSNVQDGVDACPPGGSVLLLPGTHLGPLMLGADKEVHVFGRGRATLQTAEGCVVTSTAPVATLDGLVIRREAAAEGVQEAVGATVRIHDGGVRLQACDITNVAEGNPMVHYCVEVYNAQPTLVGCNIHDGKDEGVFMEGGSVRLEDCTIARMKYSGVLNSMDGDVVLIGCNIAQNGRAGVFVNGLEGTTRLTRCVIHDGLARGVWIRYCERVTLDCCDVYSNAFENVMITGGGRVKMSDCAVRDGQAGGVVVKGDGSSARLRRCALAGNRGGGVVTLCGGAAVLASCSLCDHPVGGVVVMTDSAVTVGEDCTFARNAEGDVVHREREAQEDDDDSELDFEFPGQ